MFTGVLSGTGVKRIDYWLKRVIGVGSIAGTWMVASDYHRVEGSYIAGGCAFLLAVVLPNFLWDPIISGLKSEQDEWTRIFQGYDGLLRMSHITEREEMLVREFQTVEELRKAAERNDRHLPEDEQLRDKIELEVRKYWKLDGE